MRAELKLSIPRWASVSVSDLLASVQGGAINRGLLISGSLPIPLGGCEGQDEQNLLGGVLNNRVNGGGGVRRHVAMEMACRQLIAQSSARDINILVQDLPGDQQ
jgi:hypothetical protein